MVTGQAHPFLKGDGIRAGDFGSEGHLEPIRKGEHLAQHGVFRATHGSVAVREGAASHVGKIRSGSLQETLEFGDALFGRQLLGRLRGSLLLGIPSLLTGLCALALLLGRFFSGGSGFLLALLLHALKGVGFHEKWSAMRSKKFFLPWDSCSSCSNSSSSDFCSGDSFLGISTKTRTN